MCLFFCNLNTYRGVVYSGAAGSARDVRLPSTAYELRPLIPNRPLRLMYGRLAGSRSHQRKTSLGLRRTAFALHAWVCAS